MSEPTINDILEQMSEITNAVKERGNSATFQWDTADDEFRQNVDALVAERVEEVLQKSPVRRVPGTIIRADGEAADLNELRKNRYFPALKDFAAGQRHRYGGVSMQPFDLWLAGKMLEAQQSLKSAQIPGVASGPSDDLKAAIKALTSDTTGFGDELVPTDMANMLWDDIYLASIIAPQMVNITMPTNPFDVPLGLGDVTFRKGTQNQATTETSPSTAKSTLTATEQVAEQNWSYTLDEDAIIAMAPALRANLVRAAGETIDAFILNADGTNAATGNINLDDANPPDDAYYLTEGQDGLRHQWLVDNSSQGTGAGGDALTDADITATLALMGKYAVNPEQVRMVMDPTTYLKGMLSSASGAPGENVITMDKFGPQAVVMTGQLASYRGIPLLVSGESPLTEADGKVSATSGNNTLGQITFWNRLMWYLGFRRNVMMEIDRDIQRRSYIMVTSLRLAVAAHGTRSGNTHTAGIYNISVS